MVLIAQIINGINIGSIYALVALGYTMVYGIVKLINFAHGDIIMVGSYIILFLLRLAGVPFIPAVLISMAACAAIGVSMELLAYKPLRSAARLAVLITAIGMSLFIQNFFTVIFKPDPRPFPSFMGSGAFLLGDISISYLSVVTIFSSVAIMAALQFFVKKTRIGKAMRAVSEDAGAASLMGINVSSTISITFAIGSALAAVGGALFSSAYPVINPFMGATLGLKAFVAAVLGGIGIIPGAMLGGFLMGVIESLSKGYISSQLSDAIVFGILIIVLLIKPSGILGKAVREKV